MRSVRVSRPSPPKRASDAEQPPTRLPGYCFGAPFVLDLAAEGSIVAGAIAHPAFLEESHFEKITRTFDSSHPFTASGSHPHHRSPPPFLRG